MDDSKITSSSVLEAINELDEIGEYAFLRKYSFGNPEKFYIHYNGKDYPLKAVVGVAHGPPYPNQDDRKSSFTPHKAIRLLNLLKNPDFEVVNREVMPINNPDWTRNETILAMEYYILLENKNNIEHDNLGLIPLANEIRTVGWASGLIGNKDFRSTGGVHMKILRIASCDPKFKGKRFQGTSVIDREIWNEFSNDLKGLQKEANNIRQKLSEETLITQNEESEIEITKEEPSILPTQDYLKDYLNNNFDKILVDAPTSSRSTKKKSTTSRTTTKDFVKQDAENKETGDAGEEFVLNYEMRKLKLAGRTDLAEKVNWVSKEKGDGLGYDIISFSETGEKLLIEVKTTKGNEKTPFFLSSNEISVSEKNPNQYFIYRVFNFSKSPNLFKLKAPLEKVLNLEPVSFRAYP